MWEYPRYHTFLSLAIAVWTITQPRTSDHWISFIVPAAIDGIPVLPLLEPEGAQSVPE
jgi:hypothetical protein